MVRFITLFCFLFYAVSLYGQDKNVFIHCDDTVNLKLSEIAKNVRLINIQPNNIIKNTYIQHIYPNDKFIYIQGLKNVIILDYQGELIKNITYPNFVTGLTGDPAKQNIYVATEKNIYQYDSNGKETNRYRGKNENRIQSIFFHKNRVWIYSYQETSRDEQKMAIHQFSYLDTESNQVIDFPFEYSDPFDNIYLYYPCVFSTHNDTLYFSLKLPKRITDPSGVSNIISKENKIWKVNNMKVETDVNWSIDQSIFLSTSGYIGKYRFIQYFLNEKCRIFMTDLTTDLSTCSCRIIDDIYHTKIDRFSIPVNHNTYSCIKDNNLLIIKVKE